MKIGLFEGVLKENRAFHQMEIQGKSLCRWETQAKVKGCQLANASRDRHEKPE
jgi:hypothetical protein